MRRTTTTRSMWGTRMLSGLLTLTTTALFSPFAPAMAQDGEASTHHVDETSSDPSQNDGLETSATLPLVYRAYWDATEPGVETDDATFFADARRLTIDLQGKDAAAYVRVTVNDQVVEPSDHGELTSYLVDCTEDGRYHIAIEAIDPHAWSLECASQSVLLPADVVVDTQEPEVRVLYNDAEPDEERLHEGRLYASVAPDITIEITDPNLDLSSVRVAGVAYDGWDKQGDTYMLELPYDAALDEALPITGADKAGNAIGDDAQVLPVVVDDHAPTIEADHVSPRATIDADDGLVLFFDDETSVTLHLSDDEGLAAACVEQEEPCVLQSNGFDPGDKEGTLTLTLIEGCELTAATEVRVYDLAGNWQGWSLARRVERNEAGQTTMADQAPIYVDEDLQPQFPLALLLDRTAPVVEVSGIEDGGVYADAAEVRVSIAEANFSYLKQMPGESCADQVVVLAKRFETYGQSGEPIDEIRLHVRDFELEPLTQQWEARVTLHLDGTYVLSAQLRDAAGNVSAPWTATAIVDTTPPSCDVRFVSNAEHAEEHEGTYYRTPRKAVVRLWERNWHAMQRLEVRSVSADGTSQMLGAEAFVAGSDGSHQCEVSFDADGSYQLFVDATDVAGNAMDTYASPVFVVDTTNPAIKVTYEGESAHSGIYFDAPRTAIVEILEHNWGDDDRYSVQVESSDADGAPKVSAWYVDPRNADRHVCSVVFDQSGRYTLRVGGTDLSGRLALCSGQGGFVDSFVVDLEKPEVNVQFSPTSYVEYEGVWYLNHAVEIPVDVLDRNLDADSTSLSWDGLSKTGDVTCGWRVSEADDAGYVRRTKTIGFEHGRHVSPSVVACDLAGHETRVDGRPFVVDTEAPSIVRVSTTSLPVASYEGSREEEHASWQFFNQPTRMVFEVEDEFGLGDISLFDPDGRFELDPGFERGGVHAIVQAHLVENDESSARDAYERNVVLTVSDLAGNLHSWTLNRAGEVVCDRQWVGTDVTLNDGGVEPWALVQDSISPVVSVEGLVPGSISSQTQLAHISVVEASFPYLKTFLPTQVVVNITTREANPQALVRTEEVSVASFEEDGSRWTWSKAFDNDGHYALEASVVDPAGNASNRVEIGEFTVDKTPPVVSVTWDHDVAEAKMHEGVYYFATTRHATVRVKEHNFRAQDVSIEAGRAGTAGGWQDEGDDTHVCVVSYESEAKGCELRVSARDQAGNEAHPYEQRAFVIDLTQPVVEILNVPGSQGERAFAGEVTPVVVFSDGKDGNFDTSREGWTYELQGMRGINRAKRGDASRYGQMEESSSDGAQVTFGDFGKDQENGDGYGIDYDDIYTLTAHACDRAGNESPSVSVTFSINRFGSNFFVEKIEGFEMPTEGQAESSGETRLLTHAPQIVVHEINVSGVSSEGEHRVVRDYANMPQLLKQDEGGIAPSDASPGYSLQASTETSAYNEFAGWSEYVYTIRSGNFGAAALKENEGQGRYRVNVSSRDDAHNVNTTARYWASGNARDEAHDKSATVSFTLDEQAPQIDALDIDQVAIGVQHVVTFHMTDDITYGDNVEVLVDGSPVELVSATSQETVDAQNVSTGTYAFVVPARSFTPHVVSVQVRDYAGRFAVRGGSILVTTLVPEIGLAVLLVVAGAFVGVVVVRRKQASEPSVPHAA